MVYRRDAELDPLDGHQRRKDVPPCPAGQTTEHHPKKRQLTASSSIRIVEPGKGSQLPAFSLQRRLLEPEERGQLPAFSGQPLEIKQLASA
ncbi:hypothetical protein [Thiococcus pfennigii]|uniref:hypothetical protein n=1 Tax=Thiococcus pfennigii TaxID=1057 RepID=UPI0019032571|nr:hypothetical protein [Thiococcus pfennigii]